VGAQYHALFYPQETDPIPTVQEAVWTPRPVWVGAENLAPTGIGFSDPPARDERVAVQSALPGPTKGNKYREELWRLLPASTPLNNADANLNRHYLPLGHHIWSSSRTATCCSLAINQAHQIAAYSIWHSVLLLTIDSHGELHMQNSHEQWLHSTSHMSHSAKHSWSNCSRPVTEAYFTILTPPGTH